MLIINHAREDVNQKNWPSFWFLHYHTIRLSVCLTMCLSAIVAHQVYYRLIKINHLNNMHDQGSGKRIVVVIEGVFQTSIFIPFNSKAWKPRSCVYRWCRTVNIDQDALITECTIPTMCSLALFIVGVHFNGNRGTCSRCCINVVWFDVVIRWFSMC